MTEEWLPSEKYEKAEREAFLKINSIIKKSEHEKIIRFRTKMKTILFIFKINVKKRMAKDVLNQRYADISLGENCGWVESWLIGNCPYCGKSISIENSTYSCKRCGQILKWKE